MPSAKLLADFQDFCEVDLHLTSNMAKRHRRNIERFALEIGRDATNTTQVTQITKEEIRQWLKELKHNGSVSLYKFHLSSLKRFYRDFLGMKELVESFKFPKQDYAPKPAKSKTQLQRFYRGFTEPMEKALFLMYATSGRRNEELITQLLNDIDEKTRMLSPRTKEPNQTKHVWYSFYNVEAERQLRKYLESRTDNDQRIFPICKKTVNNIFIRNSERTGIKITAQDLRNWFCNEMGTLGVQDRYIDAFCGRVPKSVLARHYTDFSPEKLQKIYEKAQLKVLKVLS